MQQTQFGAPIQQQTSPTHYNAPPSQSSPQYGLPPTQQQLTQNIQQTGYGVQLSQSPPVQYVQQPSQFSPPSTTAPNQFSQFAPPPTQFGAPNQFGQYPQDPNAPNRLITAPPVIPLSNVTSVVNDPGFSPSNFSNLTVLTLLATAGPRKASKIDPSQMPSPAKKRYPLMYQRVEYSTDSQENPPSSGGRMTIHDRGSASPRFCRASLRAVPQTKGKKSSYFSSN
jgi:hypothetical protein